MVHDRGALVDDLLVAVATPGSTDQAEPPIGLPSATGAATAGESSGWMRWRLKPDAQISGLILPPHADLAEGDRSVIGLEENGTCRHFLVVPGVSGGGLEVHVFVD